MTQTPVRTARRNLVSAIGRFIDSIAEGAQPTRAQMTNLRDALAALDEGRFADGEDAIFLATKGYNPRVAPVATDLSFPELVERFLRLREEGG